MDNPETQPTLGTRQITTTVWYFQFTFMCIPFRLQ